MNFKRYQFLKEKLMTALESGTKEVNQLGELVTYDSLSLAYVGDAVYSLFIRELIIRTGMTQVRVIHDTTTAIICAKMQAQVYLALEDIFTEEEIVVARRARNSQVNVPKSAEVWEYRASTALEAVIGYVYLRGDTDRTHMLCRRAFEESIARLR